MEALVDPFHPVLRVLERYRADVHYLRPGAPEGTADAVQEHLGREIPASLKAFLLRWNGATLFRGALRVRGVADLAPPDADHPEVVLFADGPRDSDRWAFAETAFGHHFGRWDGERLVPLHEHFNRWLFAQTRILDENLRDEADELRVRLDVDPACGLLWQQQGERLLAEGNAEAATAAFRRASALHPDHPGAWQRLGEALLGEDDSQARGALVMAWRAARLPLAYAGAPAASAELVRCLEGRFPPGDPGFERELLSFLEERVTDVRHREGSDIIVAAALALVRCRLANGDRLGARDAIEALRTRAAGWALPPDLSRLLLALAGLQADLGNHDEAEEVIRRLRRHDDPSVRSQAELVLARVALVREEPWVEDIARGALPDLRDPADRCEAFLVLAEHARGNDASSVDAAARLASGLGDPQLSARVSLARGDLLRAQGDLAAAKNAYLACDADPEAALRAQVRVGDLCDDPAEALPFYVAAVEGYARLGLPLREAWARLRLVRCGDASQAHEAARAFRAAGLAAGVAASDGILGRLGHALDWHVNLAADAARQRHDAQRMRPPHARADADRPERRLMAHRRAIAGCDEAIVSALASDIGQELQRIKDAEGRARDPMVMRFVAGIDLLAGHPSWPAAKVMLAILAEDVRQPVAERAIVGALARSPNMTLVDALVRALDGGTEPTRLATIIEVLGWRREPMAAPRLREFVAAGSLPIKKAAITALGRIGDTDAIDVIDAALDEPELAEVASTALLLLGEFRGVDFFAQALSRGERWLTQSPGEIVGRHGGTSYRFLLTRTAAAPGPAGLGALAGLGLMGSKSAVATLIEHVDGRDTQRQIIATTALECITGHREDVEDPHVKGRWTAWWAEHEHEFAEGVRYRDGKPLTVRALIERLAHDDYTVRQSAYDELRIATGATLPFDADGPWRVQLAHRAAWARWWADHAHDLPATGWMFHGEALS
ncbi:MAG: HEAT repeat domain-containing protein [Deltaproteobacteria bacterium]|nr:HEAT repeat domain-containing protein [Deltaproteobacteria bacterium]